MHIYGTIYGTHAAHNCTDSKILLDKWFRLLFTRIFEIGLLKYSYRPLLPGFGAAEQFRVSNTYCAQSCPIKYTFCRILLMSCLIREISATFAFNHRVKLSVYFKCNELTDCICIGVSVFGWPALAARFPVDVGTSWYLHVSVIWIFCYFAKFHNVIKQSLTETIALGLAKMKPGRRIYT